jgi:hypothetical protein
VKIETFDQGGVQWMLSRLGNPSCSSYDKLLTPKTKKPAKSRFLYRAKLLGEWLAGQPEEWGSTNWTERGHDLEDEGRRWYEFDRDVEARKVGYIARDDGKTGGSPDALVGEDGGLEIKCLKLANHSLHLIGNYEPEDEHIGQVQGYMYLTGREWWDVLFYNPSLPSKVYRYERDEKWLVAFIPIIEEFIAHLDEDKAKWAHVRNLHPEHPEIQAELGAQASGMAAV